MMTQSSSYINQGFDEDDAVGDAPKASVQPSPFKGMVVNNTDPFASYAQTTYQVCVKGVGSQVVRASQSLRRLHESQALLQTVPGPSSPVSSVNDAQTQPFKAIEGMDRATTSIVSSPPPRMFAGEPKRTNTAAVFDNCYTDCVYSCQLRCKVPQFSKKAASSDLVEIMADGGVYGAKDHEYSWKMAVRSSRGKKENDTMGVVIALEGPYGLEVTGTCSVKILGQSGRVILAKVIEKRNWRVSDDQSYSAFGFLQLATCEEILQSNCLVNDTLHVCADIDFKVIDGGILSTLVTPADVLLAALKQQLTCPVQPDLVLVSNEGREFPMHRVLLASQSTVLADEQLRDQNRLVFADLDSETLEAMLNYLYGQNDKWKPEQAEKLIIVARKFGITALEKGCVRELHRQLCVEKAAGYLLIADQFGIHDLRQRALESIVQNLEEFLLVGGYEVLHARADLLAEIRKEGCDRKLKKRRLE